MNNTNTPITFNFNANTVRTVLRDEAPWFVATDICEALGYKNTSKAIADHLDDDERYNESLERGGSLVLINESGLYALVLRSRKPEARKFAKWVTSEVLPAIRKTGSYKHESSNVATALPNPQPSAKPFEQSQYQAIKFSNMVANTVQQAVVDMLLHNKLQTELFSRSYRITFNSDGGFAMMHPIERGQFTASWETVINWLRDDGVLAVEDSVLFAIAQACNERIGKRLSSGGHPITSNHTRSLGNKMQGI